MKPAPRLAPLTRPIIRLSAFSILELLIVIAIVILMAGLLAPTLGGLAGSSLTTSVDRLTGAMEFTRQQAMARHTYAYLGFQQKPTGEGGSPLPIIKIGAMISLDGTADTNSVNLRPLSKLQTISGAIATDKSALSTSLRQIISADSSSTVGFLTSANTLAYGPSVTLSNVLTFAPDGSVFLGIPSSSAASTQGFDDIIDFGVRQARNSSPPDSASDACVYLYGANGRIRVIRNF